MPKQLLAQPIIAERQPALLRRLESLKKRGIKPKFVDYWVGSDRASAVFLDAKQKRARELGVDMVIREYASTILPDIVAMQTEADAADSSVHGIMVQLPLPRPYVANALIGLIPPVKDVDALRPNSPFPSPVAEAVKALLEGTDLTDKQICVVGAGSTAGQPIIQMLREMGIEPKVLDEHSSNPSNQAKSADVLITAASEHNFVDASWLKEGVVIIDVAGNVKPEASEAKASAFTPHRGAVGPLTVHFLLENVTAAAESQFSKPQ